MPLTYARITKVEGPNDNGWYRIHLEGDGPAFVDTKRQNLAAEAADFGRNRQAVALEYSENPRVDQATGRTYPNRYYETAVPVSESSSTGLATPQFRGETQQPATTFDGGTPTDRAAPSSQSQPLTDYSRRTNREDAWRMALTSGSERAVQSLPFMPDNELTFGSQKAVALAWAKWILSTPMPDTDEIASGVERSMSFGGGPAEDDIPF